MKVAKFVVVAVDTIYLSKSLEAKLLNKEGGQAERKPRGRDATPPLPNGLHFTCSA